MHMVALSPAILYAAYGSPSSSCLDALSAVLKIQPNAADSCHANAQTNAFLAGCKTEDTRDYQKIGNPLYRNNHHCFFPPFVFDAFIILLIFCFLDFRFRRLRLDALAAVLETQPNAADSRHANT